MHQSQHAGRASLALRSALILAALVAGSILAPGSRGVRAQMPVVQGPSAAGLGRLAYLEDGDLWVKALPDGAPQRLLTATSGRSGCRGQWRPARQSRRYLVAE